MPELFYGSYYIDPSGMGCGKIIAVDCDDLHYYVDPCDLINDCIAQLPQQLTAQCVVDFFNTTLPTVPVGYFLRVDASHCIEAVPLLINNSDELVGVSATDTPGYLGAKVVGSTNLGWTVQVNTIGPMGNQQIQIVLVPPIQVIVPVPNCEGGVLRSHLNGSTYRDCGDGDNGLRAVRYAAADLTPTLVTNMYQSFLFTNSAAWSGINLTFTPSMGVFQGNPGMNGINVYDGMITIVKEGMYEIRMKGEAIINDGVSRIRLFLCIPSSTNPFILIDAKYGAETTFPGSYANAPYQSNGGADGLERMTVTLTGHSLVHLTVGQHIALGCKIDSRETNAVTPYVQWRHSVYDLQPVGVGQSNSEVAYDGPGLSFGVKRYSSHVY